ncbi:hypothetical protein BDW02DRAFT_354417 [Decorospora gaudefroyi]|uniref:Uncharacterized protein n=1 Tax=Decorospora gaudefroyi TaxID=184978 RepID=A0A6A5KE63_9PLEO|nr:hypothetical protein BDW02DRAFT_354417 [Decorospora gaudefroyi]
MRCRRCASQCRCRCRCRGRRAAAPSRRPSFACRYRYAKPQPRSPALPLKAARKPPSISPSTPDCASRDRLLRWCRVNASFSAAQIMLRSAPVPGMLHDIYLTHASNHDTTARRFFCMHMWTGAESESGRAMDLEQHHAQQVEHVHPSGRGSWPCSSLHFVVL